MSQNAIDIYNQGYYYYTGTEGYPLNKSIALTYFQQAADLGVSHAMNYLGLIYEAGEIVPKDIKKAATWFYKALGADNKNVHAAYNVARMYYYGIGVAKDVAKAFQYYKAAATMDETKPHAQSCYMVGVIYMEVYNNNMEAYKFFYKAAIHGNMPAAWYNLGFLTYNKGIAPTNNKYGQGRKAVVLLAKEYYLKSVKAEATVDALYALGVLCCQNGWGEDGCEWLQMAIGLDHEPSKKFLKMYKVSQGGSLLNLF